MATRVQIECINKNPRQDPHERIRRIGGNNSNGTVWRLTVDEAIDSIEKGTYNFYVSRNGLTIDVIIATNNGRKYLKTKNDGLQPDNLLSLPECS